jgi:hypothetical protein
MKPTGGPKIARCANCSTAAVNASSLAARLDPGLELRPVSLRQLVVSVSVLQGPTDDLVRRFNWDTMQNISSLALHYIQKVSSLFSGVQ